jgi:hypothetical protein
MVTDKFSFVGNYKRKKQGVMTKMFGFSQKNSLEM